MIEIKYSGDALWDRIERAVEKVKDRLRRVTRALNAANIPYAVIGGNAVQHWVSQVDEFLDESGYLLRGSVMLCSIARNVFFGLGLLAALAMPSVARSQTVTVVPLSGIAVEGSWEVSPDGKGVVFLGDGSAQADYLLVVNGEVENASLLSVSPDGSLLLPSDFGTFGFSSPIVKAKDGDYSVSFMAIPALDKGTAAETTATQQWSSSNSAWFAGRFGFGWQDSLGEWLAANVLIAVVGVENLAGASNTTLVTGTIVVSIPVAIGLVAGGEVVLGVGTLGTATTTTATVTTAAVEAEATTRYINLIGNAVRTGKDLIRREPTDFLP
jgi:hypothetical protein